MLLLSLISLNTLVGAVAGSVVTVAVPKVFTFVSKQWNSAKADANVAVSKVVSTVKADANSVANVINTKL